MAKVITVVVPAGPPEVITLVANGAPGSPGDLSPVANATVGGTVPTEEFTIPSTINWTLSSNLTIGSLPTPASSGAGTVSLIIRQPSSGGPFVVTWPTLKWSGGASAPVMPTSPSAILAVNLFWTGNDWLANVMGVY